MKELLKKASLLLIFIPFISWAQEAPFYSETIYGSDDRVNISELSDPALASGIVVGIAHRFARQNPSITPMTLQERYRVCAGVPFSGEPAIGDCTGIHVGGGIVLTAQHCVPNNYGCEKLSWAFNYTDQYASAPLIELPDLYQCEKILASNSTLDAVLIKLKDAKNLPKQTIDFRLGGAETVFAIGSPLGLPLKHSGTGPAIQESSTHLLAVIDVFRGNSGSPIFNTENQLIGMLTSGGEDFMRDESLCLRNFVASPQEPQESILLLRSLPQNMKKIIQRAQRSR